MKDNHQGFKLVTRRFIGWFFGSLAVGTLVFVAVWGALNFYNEYVTLAGGALIALLTALTTYYFKKTDEE